MFPIHFRPHNLVSQSATFSLGKVRPTSYFLLAPKTMAEVGCSSVSTLPFRRGDVGGYSVAKQPMDERWQKNPRRCVESPPRKLVTFRGTAKRAQQQESFHSVTGFFEMILTDMKFSST